MNMAAAERISAASVVGATAQVLRAHVSPVLVNLRKQFARVSSPDTTRQPAGTSMKVGYRLCCPSSPLTTQNVPLSLSNGLVLTASPHRSVRDAHLGAQHPVGEQPQAAQVRKSRALIYTG